MVSNRGVTGICAALALSILAACGGGGSNDSAGGGSNGGNNANGTPPSNNSPNVPPSSNDPNAPVAAGAFAYVVNSGSSISAFSIDETTGALSTVPGSPFANGDSPADIVVTPSGKFAYVRTGTENGPTVSTYAIDATTGALTRVGDPVELGRVVVITMAMHPSGRAIFVGTRREYGDVGSTVLPQILGYAIDAATGQLTSIGSTQLDADPQRLIVDPAGTFAYMWIYDNVSGGSIATYAINTTDGSLSETADSPFATRGAGYQFAFAPSGRHIYAADFDAVASTAVMVGYTVDATTGALSEIPGSPFGQSDRVTVHPSGKFVYGGEPGNDAMGWDSMTFAVDESTGTLTRVGSNGRVGYRFAFSPSTRFAYGIGDTVVYVNAVDPDTGMLTNVGLVSTGGSLASAIVITRTYR
jgi:6-phosphogluconolactonase